MSDESFLGESLDVRIPDRQQEEILEYVREYPHVWPSKSQFIRSAVYWFLRNKAAALAKQGKEAEIE